jgi:hypothetical protein
LPESDKNLGADADAKGRNREQRRLRIGSWIAMALFVAAIAVIVGVPWLREFWIYLLVPSAVAAGITMGTQEKKFWT